MKTFTFILLLALSSYLYAHYQEDVNLRGVQKIACNKRRPCRYGKCKKDWWKLWMGSGHCENTKSYSSGSTKSYSNGSRSSFNPYGSGSNSRRSGKSNSKFGRYNSKYGGHNSI